MTQESNPSAGQRVVVIGHLGQLGRALMESCAHHPLLGLDYPEIDITRPACIEQINDFAPTVVVNAAAWTDVDGAEERPDACYAVNVTGVQNLALACARSGAALVQVSTNEVFPGTPGRFYREWDCTGAVSGAYARSKEAAEAVVRSLLPGRFYICRTAWLYNNGGSNFNTKILAAAEKHGALRVVADEFGSPTYAVDLAQAIARLIDTRHFGIYHLVNEGYCSRYQWAVTLLRLAGRAGVPVTPISSGEWQRRTSPPSHAIILNTTAAALGIRLRPWQDALAACFGQ